ncbi:hypothetical protein GMD78_08915 [Ornithinibacillus sp. L9]|uniref:Uncharacterized protein n=1 Tax=Ornithinibacillus caprae TaxID=2678566 RepID=A0A6N8FFQ4_9BACI|nr:hypothetical protein [Ornithinibacillus caprae]MUK88512.1 hypothetical protein [Ornithinibacillus caprae]
MGPTFWSNTIWYILLGIMTILVLVIVFTKTPNRKHVLSLYLSVCGITFFAFEVVILMCLKAYIYFPKIFSNQHDDSVVGNIFSQTSVSAAAVFITVFNLKFHWQLIIALIYGGIEELFILLGIYQQNWYRTWMTIIGLLILFRFAKIVSTILEKQSRRIWRYIFIFFGLCTLHFNIVTWGSKAVGIRSFNETLIPNNDCSIAIIAATLNLLLAVSTMILYFMDIKWKWKAVGIFVLYFAHFFAEKYQLILSSDGWFFILTSISIWGMYLNIYLLDRLYPKPL